jgi:hypothetical protein
MYGARSSDVAQARRAERAAIGGIAVDRETAAVLGHRPHADVVELLVAEQRAGVARGAIVGHEQLPALQLLRGERRRAAVLGVERRLRRRQRAFVRRDRERHAGPA